MKRREFLAGSAAGLVTAMSTASQAGCSRPFVPERPHRYIDQAACIGCGACESLCPMGAIRLGTETSSIDPDACAECGVCSRSRVCPVDAIHAGNLAWPRTLRETFSNPLVVHAETQVGGRGSEGIKTNDVSDRYPRGTLGVFVELGRPALGTRFIDVERVVRKFAAHGYGLVDDNPVAGLVDDPARGALKPEILRERAISVLVEFIVPEGDVSKLLRMLEDLGGEVETVFNVSIAHRAARDGLSRFGDLFDDEVFRLPNGKVNLGAAQHIPSKEV